MRIKRQALSTAACFALPLFACGRGDLAYDDTTGLRVDTSAGITALPGKYTDAELLGLTGLAHEGTIVLANMARIKATSAEVAKLARSASERHTALKQKGWDLAAQLGLTPMIPSVDEGLTEKQLRWNEELTAMPRGGAWDIAFLEHELERHETVLAELRDALGRDQRPELRAYLEEIRANIETHLPEYRNVLSALRN